MDKFHVMMELAANKHMNLINAVCQLKDEPETDIGKVVRLINSMYKDEIELMLKLASIEHDMKEEAKKEIQVFSFMS